MKAGLVLSNRLFLLGEVPAIVGRDEDCAVVLTGEGVSRRHALFFPSEGSHVIVDLESANGVFVEEERVSARLLKHGDRISIGKVLFSYQGSSKEPKKLQISKADEAASGDSGILDRVLAGEIDDLIEERGERDDTLRLAILYAVNQWVGSISRLEELTPRVTGLALKVFQADRAMLLLKNVQGVLEAGASQSRSGKKLSRDVLAFSRSIAETCAKECQPLLTEDASSDPRFQEAGSIQILNIRCAMAAPVMRGESFYGVLYLDNRMQSACFSKGDLKMLSAFASQVALAIENAGLLEQVQEDALRMQQQQEILLQQEKLATLGELAAGVAHEVRSPLTVISSYAEMLLRRGDLGEQNEWVRIIQRGCSRISRIVGALLDFSRKGHREREVCSLNRLLQETLTMAEHTLSCFRKVQIRKSWASVLPCLYADSHLLQQVFLNLIMNAAQAMPNGGTLKISTRSFEKDGVSMAAVDFVDTGCGIPFDRLETIFEPFVTFGKKDGTGLGLAICKRIVEEHSGLIEVSSVEGEGTTFSVILPGTFDTKIDSKLCNEEVKVDAGANEDESI